MGTVCTYGHVCRDVNRIKGLECCIYAEFNRF